MCSQAGISKPFVLSGTSAGPQVKGLLHNSQACVRQEAISNSLGCKGTIGRSDLGFLNPAEAKHEPQRIKFTGLSILTQKLRGIL